MVRRQCALTSVVVGFAASIALFFVLIINGYGFGSALLLSWLASALIIPAIALLIISWPAVKSLFFVRKEITKSEDPAKPRLSRNGPR